MRTQSKEDKKRKKQAVCFLGHFRPKGPVFVGNLPILSQICTKSSYTLLNVLWKWKFKTFLHFMFEIENSLKSVGNFLHIQQNELFSSKSVGSMLPTVYTFGQKIIQPALLISYLRLEAVHGGKGGVSVS